MDLIYNIIIGTAILAASPFILLRMAFDSAFRRDMVDRLQDWKSVSPQPGCIWVHASSVGEVQLAKTLIRGLKEKSTGRQIVLSTFTRTGYELAKSENFCEVFRLPPDFPLWIKPLLKKLNPALIVLIEAEFWPCLLRTGIKNGTPILLVNGRMSEKSFNRYKKIIPLFKFMTMGIALYAMRGQTDADRLTQLGIPESRVMVTGNMKYDAFDEEEKNALDSSDLVVFGSTRPGDEEHIIEVIDQLKRELPGAKFAIAPRHVQRCEEVKQLLDAKGLSYQLHSKMENPETLPSLALVDQLGVLNEYYRRSSVAFVGGGFDPKFGGQNILEPARFNLPVIFGKHMNNFKEEAALLVKSGGGSQLHSPKELFTVLHYLLTHPEERKKRGLAAGNAIRNNQGALKQNLDIVEAILQRRGSPRQVNNN